MKRFSLLLVLAGLAFTHTGFAEDEAKAQKQTGKHFQNALARASRNAVRQNQPRAQPNVQRQQNVARQNAAQRQLNNANVQRGSNRVAVPNRARGTRADGGNRVYSGGRVNSGSNLEYGTRNRGNNDNARVWRDRNNENRADRVARSGNWNRGDGRRYNRSWDRRRHDRSYWRNNYTRFTIYGGGYYYWDSGYWYPAYGYSPAYSTYAYDAPIYGYNNLDPQQVMANVQSSLQQRGYNAGGVDGVYGPRTRRAILAFQRDNGLDPTGVVDADTLGALGLG